MDSTVVASWVGIRQLRNEMLSADEATLEEQAAMEPCATKIGVTATRYDENSTTMTRVGLHALVDELLDNEVDTAAALIDAYHRGDRVMIQALTAPTARAEEFERQALAEAAYAPGTGIPLEEYEAKHGLA